MNFTATSKETKRKRGLFVKYVGGWSNDKLDGHGTMEYANGRIYVGEWKKEKDIAKELCRILMEE